MGGGVFEGISRGGGGVGYSTGMRWRRRLSKGSCKRDSRDAVS